MDTYQRIRKLDKKVGDPVKEGWGQGVGVPSALVRTIYPVGRGMGVGIYGYIKNPAFGGVVILLYGYIS